MYIHLSRCSIYVCIHQCNPMFANMCISLHKCIPITLEQLSGWGSKSQTAGCKA